MSGRIRVHCRVRPLLSHVTFQGGSGRYSVANEESEKENASHTHTNTHATVAELRSAFGLETGAAVACVDGETVAVITPERSSTPRTPSRRIRPSVFAKKSVSNDSDNEKSFTDAHSDDGDDSDGAGRAEDDVDASWGSRVTPAHVQADHVPAATPKEERDDRRAFHFDHVHGPSATQCDIFSEAEALVTSALDGRNALVVAYGQTGSGKSHTMFGPAVSGGIRGNDVGLVQRASFRLFESIAADCVCFYSTKVSIVEIYNNALRDLLDGDASVSASSAVDVSVGSNGAVALVGASEHPVTCADDVLVCVQAAMGRRAAGSTNVHSHSSRSHCIVTIHIESRPFDAASERKAAKSKLQFVDLAGSECVGHSGAQKGTSQFAEASHINRSLSALSDVLAALSQGGSHVPYRNSKLTFALQDALGGRSKVLLIVCVSPDVACLGETIQSLDFGRRAMQAPAGHSSTRGKGKRTRQSLTHKPLTTADRLLQDRTAKQPGARNASDEGKKSRTPSCVTPKFARTSDAHSNSKLHSPVPSFINTGTPPGRTRRTLNL
eukprot:Opistho-2@33248